MQALQVYTDNQSLTLREQMIKRLSELKMNKAEAAARLGIHRSTVSQYLNGKYHGNLEKIENAIQYFLDITAKGDLSQVTSEQFSGGMTPPEGWTPNEKLFDIKALPEKIRYFESRDYVNTLGICQSCQSESELGLITGSPGTGKTYTLQQYANLPRVARVECNESMNTKDLIRNIESAIGIPKSTGSIDERMRNVVEFFRVNAGYLLIIDEADKLISKYSIKKIELLRNITDLTEKKVGIVLAGEPQLKSMLLSFDKRFADRMYVAYSLQGLQEVEIRKYLKDYEVDEAAMQEFVVRATNKRNGSFRLLDRTLTNVIRVLKARGEVQITIDIIKEASSMMML